MNYPNKFRRIVDNIYAGGAPSPSQLRELVKNLGIKYLISLDNESAIKLASTAADLKIKHIIIPINPSASRLDDNLRYLIKNIDKILSNFQPVYIHCLQGQDRTGLALAIFRMKKYNYSSKEAISEVKKFNYGAGVSLATQQLWNNILLLLENNGDVAAAIDDDIVSINKDMFQMSNQTPAFNPQQSWAPKADIPFKASEDLSVKLPEEAQIYIFVPQMGGYSNMGPIRGAGPVENSGNIIEI